MDIFSRRNQPVPDHYEYEVDERIRSRVLHGIKAVCEQDISLPHIIEQLGNFLQQEYGLLRQRSPSESMHRQTISFVGGIGSRNASDSRTYQAVIGRLLPVRHVRRTNRRRKRFARD